MNRFLLVSLLVIGIAVPAWAQSPDTILVNGKILTVDAQSSVREALAVRDGRIVALGTSAQMRALAGAQSRVIDLQGRTVIPGLIDSHLHAIRAALSFTTEVNWIGVRTLEEAIGRVKDAARTMKPGSWLIVAGGWNQQQFKENRRPTQAELVAVAPENPVYIQLGYAWAMLTPLAHKALGLTSEADLPGGGRFDRDANGALTGAITGPQPAIVGLFDLPIIHYSVQKWGGNHPKVITSGGGGLQHPDMRLGLMLGFLTFTLLAITLVWLRAKLELSASRVAELEQDTRDYAEMIVNNAPLTIASVKRAVIECLKSPDERDLGLCQRMVDACYASADYKEGQAAFMEKRKPAFQGR